MSSALDLLDKSTGPDDPGGFRPLMLATLTERRFSDENWPHERKLDGVRTLAVATVAHHSCGHATRNVSTPAIPRWWTR